MASPRDLKYTKSHEWVRIDGDVATFGLTDHAQSELGDITYLELPEVGGTVTQAEPFGVVESVKAASDIYAPLDGEVIDYLPASQGAQARVEPIYETLEGWSGTTAGARSWNDLPAQAVKYVRHIEELIGAPVALLSTSPERDDTILVTDPFQD